MRQVPLLIAFIATALAGYSRSSQPEKLKNISITSYSDSTTVDVYHAHEMLAQIMQVIGLSPNFELKEAKVDNVEASISRRKRYILYNPEFIKWINGVTHDKWAGMMLLAHEVGHHLNGHTIRKGGSAPRLELEADEFAGFILHKLGATLEQSQNVMKYIAKEKKSHTHPARNSRLSAIEKGWNRASASQMNDTAKQ